MRKTLTYFLFLLSVFSFAQNENKKWYFGSHAGLDFTTSPPTILTNGATNALEGCSSISDASANILFYTDGITVWGQSHSIMANGTGLFGHFSSAQSAIIVRLPGSLTLYYIFTTDPVVHGLNYSIVDMSLSAGMGSVTAKNVLLKDTTTEKLTAVRHCNGEDVWILSHDLASSNFRNFLLTSAGLNTTPVISSAGTSHSGFIGQMKSSPNFKKIGIANCCSFSAYEIFDFDNSTGLLSNSLNLYPTLTKAPYSCEFSPDGSKLYGSDSFSFPGHIYQWDLCAGSPSAIINS